MVVGATVRGLFDHGFGFDQPIDLNASDLGPQDSMFASLVDHLERITSVTLDRLTMKPGRCFAPT
jgi:hypothetical protein